MYVYMIDEVTHDLTCVYVCIHVYMYKCVIKEVMHDLMCVCACMYIRVYVFIYVCLKK